MDAMKDLKYFLLVLAILGIVWLFTGGPLRPESKSGVFLGQPQEKTKTKATGQISKLFRPTMPGLPEIKNKESEIRGKTSSSFGIFYPGTLKIKTARASQTNPNEEYIEISAPSSNKKPIRLTGLKLKNKNGVDTTIEQGASLIFPNLAEQPKQDIYLGQGEKAYIISGSSPLGVNFRPNKCLGYMKQFHDFEPDLPSNCPQPNEENLPSNLDDKCLDYIDKIPACKTFVSAPINLSTACQEYINNKINYKTCFEIHQYDEDFYGTQWRIYLNRNEEMWKKKRETITLMELDGAVIDSKSY